MKIVRCLLTRGIIRCLFIGLIDSSSIALLRFVENLTFITVSLGGITLHLQWSSLSLEVLPPLKRCVLECFFLVSEFTVTIFMHLINVLLMQIILWYFSVEIIWLVTPVFPWSFSLLNLLFWYPILFFVCLFGCAIIIRVIMIPKTLPLHALDLITAGRHDLFSGFLKLYLNYKVYVLIILI